MTTDQKYFRPLLRIMKTNTVNERNRTTGQRLFSNSELIPTTDKLTFVVIRKRYGEIFARLKSAVVLQHIYVSSDDV